MKVERLAPQRVQRTVLAHGKATVSVEAGNLILDEGRAAFAVESYVASRGGRRGHYRLVATLTEGELREALDAIEARRELHLASAGRKAEAKHLAGDNWREARAEKW